MENDLQANKKDVVVNRNLRLSVTITMILGFLSVLSLISLVLALSDIAKGTEDLKIEWYIAGISILIFGIFTVSTFITLGIMMKSREIWPKTNSKE